MKGFYQFWILALCLQLTACHPPLSCNLLGDLEVPEALLTQAQTLAFPYCTIAQQALNKDSLALEQLIKFGYKTNDDNAIDHGILFLEIVIHIGDDYFYQFIKTQSEEQQILAAKLLDAGREFTENDQLKKEWSLLLPQTSVLLFNTLEIK